MSRMQHILDGNFVMNLGVHSFGRKLRVYRLLGIGLMCIILCLIKVGESTAQTVPVQETGESERQEELESGESGKEGDKARSDRSRNAIGSEDEQPKVVRSVLPMLVYTSDLGWVGGGVFQQITYRVVPESMQSEDLLGSNDEMSKSDLPDYESVFRANVLATTKNRWDGVIEAEIVRPNRHRVRHKHRFEFIREPESTFFGIGNDTEFSARALEEGRYHYLKNWVQWESVVRAPFLGGRRKGLVDGFLRAGVIFGDADPVEISNSEGGQEQSAYVASSADLAGGGSLSPSGSLASAGSMGETVLEIEKPLGVVAGRSVYIGAGLIFDRRDSELSPTNGLRYEIELKGSAGWMGSNYHFIEGSGDFRHYLTPFWGVTIAQQIRFRVVSGDQPFWQQPVLGNDDGLRGYVLDRFVGRHSVLHILEARKWLFSVLDGNVRAGGQLFWDRGRVFSSKDSNDIFDNWKQTYGLSGLLSLWSPDLVFRVDIAFSPESRRIYAGLGYLF